MAAVHLRFIALGKSRPERRAEVHARIAAVADLDVGFELAVLALANHPEQMARLAVTNNGAILGGPRFGALVSLPTLERLAVKHFDPAFFGGRKKRRATQRRDEQSNRLHVTIITPSGSGCDKATFLAPVPRSES